MIKENKMEKRKNCLRNEQEFISISIHKHERCKLRYFTFSIQLRCSRISEVNWYIQVINTFNFTLFSSLTCISHNHALSPDHLVYLYDHPSNKIPTIPTATTCPYSEHKMDHWWQKHIFSSIRLRNSSCLCEASYLLRKGLT